MLAGRKAMVAFSQIEAGKRSPGQRYRFGLPERETAGHAGSAGGTFGRTLRGRGLIRNFSSAPRYAAGSSSSTVTGAVATPDYHSARFLSIHPVILVNRAESPPMAAALKPSRRDIIRRCWLSASKSVVDAGTRRRTSAACRWLDARAGIAGARWHPDAATISAVSRAGRPNRYLRPGLRLPASIRENATVAFHPPGQQ